MTPEQKKVALDRTAEAARRVVHWLDDAKTTGEPDNVVAAHMGMALVVHQLVKLCRAHRVDMAQLEREIPAVLEWLHRPVSIAALHRIVDKAFNPGRAVH